MGSLVAASLLGLSLAAAPDSSGEDTHLETEGVLIPSYADREGLYFTLAPRMIALGAGVFVSSSGGALPGQPAALPSSFSRGFFGGGVSVDLAMGYALHPGLALAVETSAGLVGGGLTQRIDFDSLNYLGLFSVGVGLRGWPETNDGFHYRFGLGLQVVAPLGSSATVFTPGVPRLSFDALFGPRASAGLGWVVGGVVDLGVDVEAAYVFGPSGTDMLPIMLSARAALLLF